jgi:hypothetical protein
MVAQHREAEHHHDVIEPEAVLSNLEQFSLAGLPGLLVGSLSQSDGKTHHSLFIFSNRYTTLPAQIKTWINSNC